MVTGYRALIGLMYFPTCTIFSTFAYPIGKTENTKCQIKMEND